MLPGALPSGLVGLRYALGSAWLSLVIAEQINATAGIGFLINDAREAISLAVSSVKARTMTNTVATASEKDLPGVVLDYLGLHDGSVQRVDVDAFQDAGERITTLCAGVR